MNLDLITNDAKFLLGSLYAVYIDRRKEKLPKNKAIYFEDVSSIHSSFMQEWLIEDVTDTCFELKKHGLITGVSASNTLIAINISSEGIAMMENKFKDEAREVLEWAAKIKSLIPFI